MSETPPGQGGAVLSGEPAQEGTGDRRRVLLLGGLAVAALASVGALLLSGPDEADLEPASAAAAAPVATAPTASAPPAAPAVPGRPGGTGRNPFADPVPRAAVVAEPVTAVPPLEAAPAVPSAPVSAAPLQSAPAPAASRPPAALLTLLRVEGPDDARTAAFLAGDQQLTAGVGDSFGDGLLLVSLQQGTEPGTWTARVKVGRSEPLDVVTGRPVPLT